MKRDGTFTIPRIAGVRVAVEIYYGNYDLGIEEIQALFGCSAGKAKEMKKLAQAKMEEMGISAKSRVGVSADAAYAAWGIDIKALEARMIRAEKLGVMG